VKTQRAVRDGNWKLVEERNGKQELYNLVEDIGEKDNLADEQKSKVAKMKKLLDKWEGQVDPPLYRVSLKPE
jgi:arylsulfatase A-like enzyme